MANLKHMHIYRRTERQRQRETERQTDQNRKMRDRQADLYIKRLWHMNDNSGGWVPQSALCKLETQESLWCSLKTQELGSRWCRFHSGSKVLRTSHVESRTRSILKPNQSGGEFIQPSSALFYSDPQWTKWCPPIVRRTTCWVLFTNSCAGLFWKHLHTHTQLSGHPLAQASWHEISHHTMQAHHSPTQG